MDKELGTPEPLPSGANGPAQVAESWARIRGRLREEVGEVEYRTWLRQMTLAAIDGEEVIVTLPTRFLRDWVRSHYGDRLQSLWQLENPRLKRLDLRVVQEPAAKAPPPPLRRIEVSLRGRRCPSVVERNASPLPLALQRGGEGQGEGQALGERPVLRR